MVSRGDVEAPGREKADPEKAEAVPESEERESPSEPSSNTVAEDPLPQVDSEAERKQDAGNDKPEES